MPQSLFTNVVLSQFHQYDKIRSCINLEICKHSHRIQTVSILTCAVSFRPLVSRAVEGGFAFTLCSTFYTHRVLWTRDAHLLLLPVSIVSLVGVKRACCMHDVEISKLYAWTSELYTSNNHL